VNPATLDIDTLATAQILERISDQDALVAPAVRRELPHIAQAVDLITDRLQRGGRLFYFGAGTSGRLGVLDAAECRPTFNTPPEQVQAFIAGGTRALVSPAEAVEDDEAAGRAVAEEVEVTADDAVVGIAASGATPYVLGVLRVARSRGAATIALVANWPSPMSELADVTIAPLTGPEVIAGSTRMKAGTAQKMVLNMLSTASMIRLGKVYRNLMVDVQPTNRKLRERARRILQTAVGLPPDEAQRLLEAASYQVKTAVVMALAEVDVDEARRRLAHSAGHVRKAIS